MNTRQLLMAVALLLVLSSAAVAGLAELTASEQLPPTDVWSPFEQDFTRARLDTLWIFDADFEDLTGDNAGWQGLDMSGWPAQENYWHHDTIRTTGHPHLGDSTWWCGTYNHCWVQPRGYGNDWLQVLSRDFPEIAGNTNPGDPLALDWDQRFAMEHDYDYGYVEVSTDGGQNWTTLYTVSNPGFSGKQGTPKDWDDPTYGHVTLDLSTYAGSAPALRFRFESDGALSPQDEPDNALHSLRDGAWQLDNISFTGPGGVFWLDDCQSGNLGWVHDDTEASSQTGLAFTRGQFGIDFLTLRDFTCDDRPFGSWMYAAVSEVTGRMVDYQWSWLMSPPIDISGATKLVGQWDHWTDCPAQANDYFNLLLAGSDDPACVTDPTAFIDESPGVWYGGPFWGVWTDNWDVFAGNDWLAILWQTWSNDAPEPGFDHMAGLFANRERVGVPIGDPGTTWASDSWNSFNDWFREDLAFAMVDTARVRAFDDQGLTSVSLKASNDGGATWHSYACLQDAGSYWYRVPPPTDLMVPGSEIIFYYEAIDEAANVSVYPADAPDVHGEFSILPIHGSTVEPGILLVDKFRRRTPGEERDYSHLSQYYYEDALARLGYEWDIYEVEVPSGSILSHGPDTTGMKYYDTQIWSANWYYSYALRPLDQYHLTQWLDQASEGKERNLLLSGNNFGYGLFTSGSETLDFYNTWLGTEFIYGSQGDITVDSLPGLVDYGGGYDFITDGGCILQGGCPVLGYFDVIEPVDGLPGAERVADYVLTDMTHKSAGVAYTHQTEGYQTVNLGFSIELMVGDLQPNGYFIDGGPHRRSFLGNIMDYFGKEGTLPQTFLVRPDGTGDYPTIQAAINAAAHGDTVELASGTFTGGGNRDIDFLGKAITVRSVDGAPALCVIDCQTLGRGFVFNSAETTSSVLRGVTILNGSGDWGGGVACGAAPTIVNCVFADCSANFGGGLFCSGGSPLVTDCVFTGNEASGGGGAVGIESFANPTFERCVLSGNTATFGAGMSSEVNCAVVLTECVIVGNVAITDGGAFFCNVMSTLDLQSCTIAGNSAPNGSGLYVTDNSEVTLDRTIVAFGTGGEAVACGFASASLSCSNVYGNAGGDYVGCIAGQNGVNGNFSADPRFCDPGSGDYHLYDGSPCENADGCGLVGALGVGCGRIWYVPSQVPTITAAMDSAAVGDTVVVACGVYEEYNIPMESGVVLRSETGEADCAKIEALSQGPVIVCAGVDSTARIEGFTITGGSESGVYMNASSPRFVNCAIEFNSNDTRGSGGGVFGENGSSPEFVDCVFDHNSSTGSGGGLYLTESTADLSGCLFAGNTAPSGGAIAGASSSTLTLWNCTLTENSSDQGVGVIDMGLGSTVDITNCIIAFSPSGTAVSCIIGPATIVCSDVYGNADGDYVGCIAGQNGLDGNFSADPVFCGPANPLEPYALRSDSPCAAHNNPGCWWIGALELGCISLVEWDGGGDGVSWHDPLNWDPDQVPGSNDHAVIQLDGTYDVQFDDRSQIWALTHGAETGTQTLDIQGGTLTVTHGAVNTSEVIVRSPAAFEADATSATSVITNESGAVLTLEGGDLIGSGSCSNSGTVAKTGAGRSSVALSFLNEGEGRGGGHVQVDAGTLAIDGEFNNVGRVTVNTGGTGIVSSHFFGGRNIRGSVVNSGIVEVDGTLDVGGDFENLGRVTVNTGGTGIVSSHFFDRETRAGAFTNAESGTLSVDGSLEVDGGFENLGRVTVNTGGTGIVSSHFFDDRQPAGGFDNQGSMSIAAGGSFTAGESASFTTSGTFETDGSMTVDGGGAFVNTGSAVVGIGGDFFAGGDLTNSQGADFINQGRTVLGAEGSVSNSGYFHHEENAVLAGSGTFDTSDGLTTMKGIVSPGASHGILTFIGDFIQSETSQLHLEIGGYVPGIDYDRLDVTGPVELAGTVSLTVAPEFAPVAGDSFDVIVHGGVLRSLGGRTDFGCFSGLDFSDTLHMEPVQQPAKFQLLVVEGTTGNAAPLAVDDADSVVGYMPITIPVLDNDSDPDLDALRIIDVLTDGTDGLVYVEDEDLLLTYVGTPGFEGTDAFDYVITDCAGGADTATVTVTVTAPPRTLLVPDDYASIQDGLDAASPGDTVLIACGTYYESDIAIPSGVIVTSETGEPDCVVIDASGRAGRGLVLIDVDATTVVRGLTVTGAASIDAGGGVYISGSSPRIEDCLVTGNSAPYGGGIACADTSSPVIERCLFIDNVATTGGGGLACAESSSPDVTSCTFSGNAAPLGGGILAGVDSSPAITGTIISFSAGGVAVACEANGTVTVACSDVFGNAGGDYVECIEGLNGVDGNFSEDPLFCDAETGNYHLMTVSPCADAPGCGVVGALPVGCIGEAEIDVTPGAIEFILLEGEMDCAALAVSNDGRAPLSWLLREEEGGARIAGRLLPTWLTLSRATASPARRADSPERVKGVRPHERGAPPERGAGGPDAFGYRWIDSDEPGGPAFAWQDISGVGTVVPLGDDDSETVALPFAFPFYGGAHEEVTISSNGYLTFGPVGDDYSNDPVPDTFEPNDLVAPFWTDLDPSGGGTVHYGYDEVGGRFIVQYTGVDDYWGTGLSTFQVALYPNGSILFQYLDMQGDPTVATIGIENATASVGLEVVFSAMYVHSELAVLIEDTAPFMTEDPPGGVVPGIGSIEIAVCIDAAALAVGTYLYDLVLESNDATDPQVIVPVSLTVTTPAAIAVDSTAIHVIGDPGIVYYDPLTLYNDGGLDLVWRLGKREARSGREGADDALPAGSHATVRGWPALERDGAARAADGRGAGGPDEFGYVWVDSDGPEGPTFAWRDITGVGTSVSLGDDDFVAVELPFGFAFYEGAAYEDTVRISSNGYLTFGTDATAGGNTAIPSETAPNDLIAPFWDDLDPGQGGTVHHYYDPADTSFIVQYTDVPRASGVGVYTFEVILRREWSSLTDAILFQYLDMQGELESATVGVENEGASVGLSVVHDAAYVHDNLAVSIEELYGWLDATPRSGTVSGGDSLTVELVTDCRRAPSGDYQFQLVFYSNDPVDPDHEVAYFLTVTGTGIAEGETLPGELVLRGNFPNPFNPTTAIRYDLPADARVGLRIYDVTGRLVRTLVDDVIEEGGYRSATWDGRDEHGKRVGSGVYFYKLEANGKALRRKMILLK